MLIKLTSIIEFQSEREKSWEQTVTQYGGPKRILDNPEDLQTVANIIEDGSVENAGTRPIPGGGSGAELKFNRKELLEVQQPLSKLLDESRVYYERKLEAQVEFLANQIERSTQRILHRLDGGSWMKIQDPDLKTVWRDNVSAKSHDWSACVESVLFLQGWRASVKNRVFIMGLHDYYQDRYAMALAKSRTYGGTDVLKSSAPNIANVSVTAEIESANPAERATSPDPDEYVIPVCSDKSVLDDKDYLQYLTMPYLSATSEAFDEDGSGFVRISEVNDFTSEKPEDWTLLQWIAYWARGWGCESAYYSQLISSIYEGMCDRLGDALTENAGMVFNYLISDWSSSVKALTWCSNDKFGARTDTPLDDLVRIHMKLTEERIENSLNRLFFTLDSPEALGLVCESTRLEKVCDCTVQSIHFLARRSHIRWYAHIRTYFHFSL